MLFRSQKELVRKLREEYEKPIKGDGVNLTPKDKSASQAESTLRTQRSLQREIQDLIDASTRKQLSADDAEVQSVKDKYEKMRKKAIEFNQSSKAIKFGLKTNIGGLNLAETLETQAVINKQSNLRLKERLSEDLKLYQEFDSLREKFGLDSAKKQFEQQGIFVKDRFDNEVEYLRKLEEKQGELSSVDISDRTEAQKQELEIVTDNINALTDYRKKKDAEVLKNALDSTISFNEDRKTHV